jgi:hypothetical protein
LVRIFFVLATLSTLLLILSFGLGLRVGDWNRANRQLAALRERLADDRSHAASSHQVPPELADFQREHRPMLRRRTTHFMVALLTALFVLFVNSISITYFIGTGRWAKEVAATYRLDDSLVAQSLALKKHAFPWAMAGIAAVLVTAALGAAADTDSGPQGTWALVHYIAAMASIAVIVWAFLVQGTDIRRNSWIVQQMLDQVRRIRQEKGLSVEG